MRTDARWEGSAVADWEQPRLEQFDTTNIGPNHLQILFPCFILAFAEQSFLLQAYLLDLESGK